jgi:HSP20 family protein
VIETEKEVKVVAELPGMEQNDIDLSLHDGTLTLKDEKKSESNGAHYSERWHGKFQRSLQVGRTWIRKGWKRRPGTEC